MSAKRKIQMIIDFIMTMLLPILMAYSLVGEAIHEWLGIVMFFLFSIHHAFNWRWYKNITKGPYLPLRVLNTIINLLLVVIMVVLPVSGIIMAKHTFSFIHFSGVASARLIHLLASYWGYVLMCIHIGLHCNIVFRVTQNVINVSDSFCKMWLLRFVSIVISIYGVYAFFTKNFIEYMFLKTQFVFFDFDEPLYLFFMDYIAIMILFVCIGYYVTKGIVNFSNKRKD